MVKAAEIGALSKKFKGYFEKNIIKTHKGEHHQNLLKVKYLMEQLSFLIEYMMKQPDK